MSAIIYGLCALTALACAFLLLVGYSRTSNRLLLWGGLSFAGLTISNALLVIDKLILPTSVDLSAWRSAVSLISLLIFLYGLIMDAD